MDAVEAAAKALEAAEALNRVITDEAYAQIEHMGGDDYRPRVVIETDTAWEIAKQAEVEGA